MLDILTGLLFIMDIAIVSDSLTKKAKITLYVLMLVLSNDAANVQRPDLEDSQYDQAD